MVLLATGVACGVGCGTFAAGLCERGEDALDDALTGVAPGLRVLARSRLLLLLR